MGITINKPKSPIVSRLHPNSCVQSPDRSLKRPTANSITSKLNHMKRILNRDSLEETQQGTIDIQP